MTSFGGEVVGTRVEYLRDGSPSGPRRQGPLLGQCRGALRVAQCVDQFDGGDVGADAGFGSGRDQDLRAGREVRGAAEFLDGGDRWCRFENRRGRHGCEVDRRKIGCDDRLDGRGAHDVVGVGGVVEERDLGSYRSGRPSARRSR